MCSAGCGTGSPSPSRRGLHGGSRPAKTPTRPSRPGGRTPTKSERGGGDDSDIHGDGRTGARRLVGAGGPDVGAVSRVRRLDQVEDEMREAIAHLAGLPESEVEVDVRATLPEDCVEHVGQARRGGCARGRWGSWVGCCRAVDGRGGRWVVQICCKGRCGVRVVEVKPHDSAVLSAVRGVRGRLCNRFGHCARVRCPIRVRCRLAGRALSRGSPVAGPRVRGSIPGLARRAGLHKQGSAPAVHRTRLACSYLTMTACRLVWA